MKIGLTGATGFIGRNFTRLAESKGHSVIGYSRKPSANQRCMQQLDVGGLDAMVHLAGESVLGLWTKAKKQRIYDSRILTTRRIVDAMRQNSQGPKVLVTASGASVYGDRGDEILNETSAPGGENRLQPVDVRDVAECFVKALSLDHTIHRTYELGGPRSYSWKELYATCRRLIPGARRWKPMVGQPVFLAKLVAATVMKVPVPIARFDRLRFNVGQVQMSQEDSVCDIAPTERDLDLTFRDFEQELREYADQIW